MGTPGVLKNKVGMGMPVYNGERYIEQSIRANLAQTFGDFHLIISDNASTDRTAEICRDYAAGDKRVHYFRNAQNLGASKNFARCLSLSGCEYFRWANADDLPEPSLVEKCTRILDDRTDTILAYGKTRLIDQEGSAIEFYDDNLDLRQESVPERFLACLNQIGLNNVIYGLMRRETLAKTRLFGTFLAADVNLVAELSLYGKFHEIPEVLFSRRMHPQASSWDRKDYERQKDFWDPRRKKLWMQTWKRSLEFNKAVLRSPVPLSHKWAIMELLLKKVYWERGAMAGEIGDYIRYKLLKPT
jgi:glycosyltransferase involved in cell wall biosynthesis